MTIYVLFDDESIEWKNWNYDLFSTIPYEPFCRSLPRLHPLLTTVPVSAIKIKGMENTAISLVAPGDIIYVDLHSYGFDWYSTLNLPDSDYSNYVVQLTYTSWYNSKHLKINGIVPIFNEDFSNSASLSADFVHYWGHKKNFDSSTMILIDKLLLNKHPQMMSTLSSLPSLPP